MNRKSLTVLLAGAALASSAVACDNSKLTEVNKNPNAPEQVNPSLLFPTAVVSSVGQNRSTIEILPSPMSTWPQHLAEYQYPEASYYQMRPTTADGWWAAWYTGPLQDLAQTIRQAQAANHPNQVGPALVMRAWNYEIMTNLWGDIPFSQANKGDSGAIAPAYDKQQVIYDSLLKNMTDANTMMTAAAGATFGSQDPIYKGDVAKWKKFANSLHARLAMDLSKADPNKAKAEVAAAVAAGGFTSNADNAQLVWPGDGVNDNPWYSNQKEGKGTRDDARFSATFIDTLSHLNDPRLPIFARPVQDTTCGAAVGCHAVNPGGYRGMANGLEAGPAGLWGPKASRLGAKIFAKSQPSYIMTYAEFSFIKAEAAERGWISGSAAQFYQDGITASMQQWGVADADIATYLAQPAVQYKGGTAGLAQIGVQKWISLFTEGVEAWMEWRRTGYPNLTPALNARTAGGVIPRRMIYPQTEQSFNLANLQAALANEGGSDALNTRLWIDK
jgi:hypothetical protein